MRASVVDFRLRGAAESLEDRAQVQMCMEQIRRARQRLTAGLGGLVQGVERLQRGGKID